MVGRSDISIDLYYTNDTSTRTYEVSYTSTYIVEEYELIKKLIKLEAILKAKSYWNNYIKPLVIKLMKPSIQLRNIPLMGMGWA